MRGVVAWMAAVLVVLTMLPFVAAVTFPKTEFTGQSSFTAQQVNYATGVTFRTNTSGLVVQNATAVPGVDNNFWYIINSSNTIMCKWNATNASAQCALPYVGEYSIMGGNDTGFYYRAYEAFGGFPTQGEVLNFTNYVDATFTGCQDVGCQILRDTNSTSFQETVESITFTQGFGSGNVTIVAFGKNESRDGYVTRYFAEATTGNELQNCTFSFDNGTGILVNDSTQFINGSDRTCLSDKYVPVANDGETIRWQWFFSDNVTDTNITIQSYNAQSVFPGVVNYTKFPGNFLFSNFANPNNYSFGGTLTETSTIVEGASVLMWFREGDQHYYLNTSNYQDLNVSSRVEIILPFRMYYPWVVQQPARYKGNFTMIITNYTGPPTGPMYAFTSSNGTDWTPLCGGDPIDIDAYNGFYNPAVSWYNNVTYVIADDALANRPRYYNGTGDFYDTLCTGLDFQGYSIEGALNPWIGLFNDSQTGNLTMVMEYSRIYDGSNYEVDWAKGPDPLNFTIQANNNTLGPPMQDWEGTSPLDQADMDIAIVPAASQAFFNISWWDYYNGNQNNLGLAYDVRNRSFYEAHNVTRLEGIEMFPPEAENVTSNLTAPTNISPSNVTFYNRFNVPINFSASTGNASPVTYDVVVYANGINTSIINATSALSTTYNFTGPANDVLIYVTAHDGFANATGVSAMTSTVYQELLNITLNNTYVGAPVSTFCAYVNGSAVGCTVTGGVVYEDVTAISASHSYLLAANVSSGLLYNVSRVQSVNYVFNVTDVETLNTRPSLQIVGFTTDKTLYWNKTDARVLLSNTSNNGGVNASTVYLIDGSVVSTNVSVNSLSVGAHNATEVVTELVEGMNQSTNASYAFNITKLAAGAVVSPSGVTLTSRYNQLIQWNASTGALGAVNYTVVLYNGTNTTLGTFTGTNVSYNFSAQNIVGAIIYVRAADSYVNDTAAGSAFNISLGLSIDFASCPAIVYPNEDNLPVIARIPVNFSVTSQGGFAGTTQIANLTLGGVNNFNSTCAQLTDTGDTRTYSCGVPMNSYDAAGEYVGTIVVTAANSSATATVPGDCTYGELLASQRITDAVFFPTASAGVVNAPGNTPVKVRNTGNADFNLSILAYNLVGRTVPATTLAASTVKAGLTLGSAVTLGDNTTSDLNMVVNPGVNAQGNISMWLSMPSNQLVQEYYTPVPWQVVVQG